MKTIAVIVVMLLCGIGAGYEVGDHAQIVLQTLGMVNGAVIGNITAMDGDFICINCTEMMDRGDESPYLVQPYDVCIAKNQIAMIRGY